MKPVNDLVDDGGAKLSEYSDMLALIHSGVESAVEDKDSDSPPMEKTEFLLRINAALKLLSHSHPISKIVPFLANHYRVKSKTAAGYVKLARRIMVGELNADRPLQFSQAYWLYSSIVAEAMDNTNKARDYGLAMKAREKLDDLLQLAGPMRFEINSRSEEVVTRRVELVAQVTSKVAEDPEAKRLLIELARRLEPGYDQIARDVAREKLNGSSLVIDQEPKNGDGENNGNGNMNGLNKLLFPMPGFDFDGEEDAAEDG